MATTNGHASNHSGFFTRIILPTLLTLCLFILTLFFILIPAFENAILERKREMIRELTQSAWSVLAELEAEERAGKLTREVAQQRAIDRIQFLRYGDERKDYFWITDMEPRMVMHPYRPDLNGKNVADYADPAGKKLFSEFVKMVREKGEGYVDYMWQWKDDESRIVPKLSYVKGFEPWGWIIGTGIYVEDVKEEIGRITRHLIFVSLGITVVITLLLLFITWQSLTIEKRRRRAEDDLRLSREKYKTLVDAATEGFIMVIDGKVFFANQTVLGMLGYGPGELVNAPVEQLLAEASSNSYWNDFLEDKAVPAQYPAQLRKSDGGEIPVLLSTSKISFEGKSTIVMIAKDMEFHQQLREELGESKEKYETLTHHISAGVIRAALGSKGQVLEANPAAAEIFGCEGKQDVLSVPLQTFIHDEEEYAQFLRDLNRDESVKNRILRLRNKDGRVPTVSISAVLIKDENQRPQFFDAIIEDITAQKKSEEERDDLIVELQTALLFLNQPIRHSLRALVECDLNQPIRRVAEIMSKEKTTAILVASVHGEYLGIVTDRDIRARVIAGDVDAGRPVYEIMSAPLITISDHALIFEAALLMQEKNIRHLAVKDNTGSLIGMITGKELLQVHRYSSAVLLRQIQGATTLDEMIEAHERVPRLVKGLIDSGANARNITRIITTVSDTITNNILQLSLEELGPPPVSFAFMALGSEGREEQTLLTDQDNAIIYEDAAEEQVEEVQQYFIALGEKVCDNLAQAGYTLCKGDVMAKNPQWCQPFTRWKAYFSDWIINAQPPDLCGVKIFFDYRYLFGDARLVEGLTRHIHDVSEGKAAFYQHLAENIVQFKPPLGLFGNIVLKSKDGHPESFDIKEAMIPIVDFARIYAIRYQITETNTLARLQKIYEQDVLTKSGYENAQQAYDLLMQIRFKHQATLRSQNQSPDNYINPKMLTNLEQIMLKKAFSQIGDLQSKLRFDFTGSA